MLIGKSLGKSVNQYPTLLLVVHGLLHLDDYTTLLLCPHPIPAFDGILFALSSAVRAYLACISSHVCFNTAK